ncbi:MAG TPA: TldD/PmbA family protein, partial [Acidimicrobiales bacterium]|nr:TldD/PmbA family protein [Acidimicrobiales bacterium]
MEEKLLTTADKIIALGREDEQIEIVAVHEQETEIRVYEGEIESFTASESQGVGIRVIQDGRQGMAYAGTLDDQILKETLIEARDNSTFGTYDEFVAIAEPDGVQPVPLNLYNPKLSQFSTEDKIALAKELEKYIRSSDERIVGVESTEYVDSVSASAIVTSSGIRRSSYEGGCYVAASSLASDGKDMQTGFGFSVGRNPELLDIEKAGSQASERATRLLGAKKAQSGRQTVILDPYVTAQFLGIIGSTFSGESLLKGRSLFADREGEQIASKMLTLVDDPTDPEAFTATEVDGEGLASRKNILINKGFLEGFLHNSY